MTYRKIEILERINKYTLLKYVVFQQIYSKKFFLFYEFTLHFNPIMMDAFGNKWDVFGTKKSLLDISHIENKEPDIIKKITSEFEDNLSDMRDSYPDDIKTKVSFVLEPEEIDRVIQLERKYAIEQLLKFTPQEKHQNLFGDELTHGSNSLEELLDSYCKRYYNKSLRDEWEARQSCSEQTIEHPDYFAISELSSEYLGREFIAAEWDDGRELIDAYLKRFFGKTLSESLLL